MYTITIDGTEQLMKKFDTIQNNFGVTIDGVMNETAHDLVDMMKGLAPNGATGRLKDSIDYWPGGEAHSIFVGPKNDGGQFPPSRYGEYVDTGGGPGIGSFVNVTDLASRRGLDNREAFAFAKFMSRTGRAIQRPTFFIAQTASVARSLFFNNITKWLSKIIQ